MRIATLKSPGNKGTAPPPSWLTLVAGLVGLLVALPVAYIFTRAWQADPQTWQRLLNGRLWELLRNTLLLVAAVTAGGLLIGVSAAWLTERSDLPGRKAWRWMLALPLAIPAYIGGIVHLALLRPHGGLIPKFLETLLGHSPPTPSPLGFWGAAFILTIFTYPYIYLLSAAAFRSQHAALEEAARTLGRNSWQTFWEITLPSLRPGIAAGVLLVALDVLADYGTVALLRYETFSSAIFVQLSGRYDRSAAALLSSILVFLAMIILWAELRLQGQARFTQVESNWRPAAPVQLGRWRLAALWYVLSIVCASLLVPVVVLSAWSMRTLLEPNALSAVMRSGSLGFVSYLWNSLWSSALAGLIAVTLALAVAVYAVRYPSRLSVFIARFCQVGYALPGVVIALSLVFIVNSLLPNLYATPFVVVIAYVFRHMPQAVRGSEAALGGISGTLEEAARLLGRTPRQTTLQVTLPLALPGLLAAFALVFLTSLKELPATLLLRPAGFDTLAVRVWIWATDGFYIQAAPAALALVLLAAIPLAFLMRREAIFR